MAKATADKGIKKLAEEPHGYEFLGPYVPSCSRTLTIITLTALAVLEPSSSPSVFPFWSTSSCLCAMTSLDARHLCSSTLRASALNS